jgi:iron complex outermembrane receptor protein
MRRPGSAASRWNIAPNNPLSRDPSVLNGLTARNTQFLESTSAALFGQLSWKVTDAFTIQPGARLNYDKKSGFNQRRVFTGTGTELTGHETDARSRAQLAIFQPQVSAPEDTDWNLTYDLSLSYKVAPDVLAYGTYAKSFKTIGINQNGLPTNANGQPIAAAGTIRPEKVDHFEIGLKSQFWNRKATLNLAAFRTEIRDYQATVINGEFGVLRGFLANAEKVSSQGIEADFSIRPSERFTAYASGAYTDAQYDRFRGCALPAGTGGRHHRWPGPDPVHARHPGRHQPGQLRYLRPAPARRFEVGVFLRCRGQSANQVPRQIGRGLSRL